MHGGGFSLIRLFTSFAMLGAEWVMWVLVALSVASVAVILERARGPPLAQRRPRPPRR